MRIKLNSLRWFARWPIKWVLFGLAYALVCFPYPHLLARHLARWSDPASLIEPNAPELEPLSRELSARLGAGPPCKNTLAIVEQFVYEKVPYEWDWNTWGMADYIPTVAEVLEKGHEDCDGRAVVAASLLEGIGVRARLVTDFTHVWVATDLGQTMGPRKHKAIEMTDHGMKLNTRGLWEMPRAMAFGVSVFPLMRELILVVVAWVLLLDRRLHRAIAAASLILLVGGLFSIRHGGSNPNAPTTWSTWLGLLGLVLAVVLPLTQQRRTWVETASPDP